MIGASFFRRPCVAALASLLALLSGCAAPVGGGHVMGAPPATPAVEVAVLAFNDFHGNLEPPRQTVGSARRAGRHECKCQRAARPGWRARLIACAQGIPIRSRYRQGDLTSASPLASSLFLDEPTVETMNRLGLDFNAVGNHEFDRGQRELLRLQNGRLREADLARALPTGALCRCAVPLSGGEHSPGIGQHAVSGQHNPHLWRRARGRCASG